MKILTCDEKLEKWGYGEWVEEVDHHKWKYKHITCELFRNSLGALCGYVYVPKEHLWFGKEYDDIEVDVHGGLTFAEFATPEEFIIGFDCAHSQDLIPFSVDPLRKLRNYPLYTLLLDENSKNKFKELNNRLMESKQRLDKYLKSHPPTYKNVNFVKTECENLVDQMLSLKDI